MLIFSSASTDVSRWNALLRRTIHSLYNKMTESNMDTIAGEMRSLYAKHPRAGMGLCGLEVFKMLTFYQ